VGIHSVTPLSSTLGVLLRLQDRTSVGPVPPFYALQSPLFPLPYRDRVHQHSRSLTTHSGPHTLGLALRGRLVAFALQRTLVLRLTIVAVTSDSTYLLTNVHAGIVKPGSIPSRVHIRLTTDYYGRPSEHPRILVRTF